MPMETPQAISRERFSSNLLRKDMPARRASRSQNGGFHASTCHAMAADVREAIGDVGRRLEFLTEHARRYIIAHDQPGCVGPLFVVERVLTAGDFAPAGEAVRDHSTRMIRRSVVRPKLVSKKCTRGMRISRSTIWSTRIPMVLVSKRRRRAYVPIPPQPGPSKNVPGSLRSHVSEFREPAPGWFRFSESIVMGTAMRAVGVRMVRGRPRQRSLNAWAA